MMEIRAESGPVKVVIKHHHIDYASPKLQEEAQHRANMLNCTWPRPLWEQSKKKKKDFHSAHYGSKKNWIPESDFRGMIAAERWEDDVEWDE